MNKKRIFLFSAVLLILGAVILGYFVMRHSGEEVLTVSQLKAQGNEIAQEQVKVKGIVKAGSIKWDNQNRLLKFVLGDMQEELEISYQGVFPEDFKPGVEIEISGRYNTAGIFQAQTLKRKNSALCSICH